MSRRVKLVCRLLLIRRSALGAVYLRGMELTVVIRADGGGYRSEVRELPGCVAFGPTLRELGKALDEAVAVCLGDTDLTLLYLELAPGEVAVSAVPGALEQLWRAERAAG
jgi:predicted RNase H-like HicB family nuclease